MTSEDYRENRLRHHHPAGPRTEPVHEDIDPRDFLSDEDFQKMMAGGPLRTGESVGPEDYTDDTEARHQACHTGPGHPPPAPAPLHASNYAQHAPYSNNPGLQDAQRHDEPPLRQDHSPRPPAYTEEESAVRRDDSDGDFSMPVATVLGQPVDPYGPPAVHSAGATNYGASGGYGRGRPEGHGYDAEGYGQGYEAGRPVHTPPQRYSHVPSMASAYDAHTDPALFHQVAQKLHTDNHQPQPQHPSHHQHESHFAAHAQAYGPDSGPFDVPMDSDTIGAAAAVQALKISAAQNQAQGAAAPAHASGHVHPVQAAAAHASPSKPPPSPAGTPGTGHSPAPAPEVPAAGGGAPQDKIIALAMAQAAKLFDKHNGGPGGSGDSAAKVQAMHSAASTAMRLCSEYKTTGKVNLQPSEMQKLIGVAMSLL